MFVTIKMNLFRFFLLKCNALFRQFIGTQNIQQQKNNNNSQNKIEIITSLGPLNAQNTVNATDELFSQ